MPNGGYGSGVRDTVIGLFVIVVLVGALRTCSASQSASSTSTVQTDSTSAPDVPKPRLTELRGTLSRRREYDLWLIKNVSNVVDSSLSRESPQGKFLAYCMITVYGAEQSLDYRPVNEYALQPDGTVLVNSGKPPMTMEQRFHEGERLQSELESGGGPVVQDCAGSLAWFGTWHNQPMPSDATLREKANKARADLKEIDNMLDPRLVESLPTSQQ